jgi:hypothetical protein
MQDISYNSNIGRCGIGWVWVIELGMEPLGLGGLVSVRQSVAAEAAPTGIKIEIESIGAEAPSHKIKSAPRFFRCVVLLWERLQPR